MTDNPDWKFFEDTSGHPVYLIGDYADKVAAVSLNKGDEIAVININGYVKVTVTANPASGECTAESEHYVYPLTFNADKGYWVCSAVLNKKCLEIIGKSMAKESKQ